MFSFMSSQPIPPGATIVVPPDPAPFNAMVFLQNVSQIFSQLRSWRSIARGGCEGTVIAGASGTGEK
jgi:hypothetical protein